MRISIVSTAAIAAAALVTVTAFAAPDKHEAKRFQESAQVVQEIRNAPDAGIPDGTWKKAQCVLVIPSLKKAGFIVGGEFGSGVMSCRQAHGEWGPPVFMEMTKGSAGFQIGAQSIDLVLLIMNTGGAEKLLANKVTLGTDASVAAGPVGRHVSAATDAQMTAGILSYSRTKGLFAGVDISGGSLKPDESDNARLYGEASARDVALGTRHVAVPAVAQVFTNALAAK